METTIKRSNEGILEEIRQINICIKKEQNYLSNGQRLGTWHYPSQRIKEYNKIVLKLQKQL